MVIFTTLFKFTILLSTCALFLKGDNITINNSDMLVLSPVQFINMVMKEKMKNSAKDWRHCVRKTKCNHTQESTTELSELSDDETRLKRRKVWSRWGKWSECSVTCGGGTMRRQRLCVAGRCAPGEHEEQSRPCASTPCTQTLPLSDDSHDLE